MVHVGSEMARSWRIASHIHLVRPYGFVRPAQPVLSHCSSRRRPPLFASSPYTVAEEEKTKVLMPNSESMVQKSIIPPTLLE